MFSEAKVAEFFCIAHDFSLVSRERCILHRTLLRSNRLYVRESVKDVSEKRIIEEDENSFFHTPKWHFTFPKWHFTSLKWHFRNIT